MYALRISGFVILFAFTAVFKLMQACDRGVKQGIINYFPLSSQVHEIAVWKLPVFSDTDWEKVPCLDKITDTSSLL